MTNYMTIALTLLALNSCSESARILAVFPIPSISHQVVFRPITQELARRGHEVVVLTPDPAFKKGKTPKNLTEIDVHDLSYKLWSDSFHATSTGKSDAIFTQMRVAFDLINQIIEKQFLVEELANIIEHQNETFDLLLLEACARPALALTHVFKVPTVLVSSFGAVYGNFESVGAPVHALLFPDILAQKINDLTLWDKFNILKNNYEFQNLYSEMEIAENAMIKNHFGSDVPDLSVLKKNVDLLLLNFYPIWDSNRPVPPNVIYMGGIHQKPQSELPKDLKSYLDNSKNGVIYISFGTNVSPSLLPPEKIELIAKTFSQLNYDVLWKWDKEVLPGQPKNVQIGKWFPQSDMLRHPNIKLFITQGGLQSTDEAIIAGVPLLGMPMLGDQWYNVEMYVKHKIGKRLDMETLTEEQLKKTILTLIEDKSYRRNIENLRTIIYDQPMSPLDRAIWWIEYVIRHKGASHLRSPAANITWYEYLEIPLVSMLLTIFVIISSVIMFILYFVYQYVSKKYLMNKKLKQK